MTLAAAFPPVDRDDWLDAVDRATGGRSIDDLATVVDGLTVLPLYTRADAGDTGHEGFPGLAPFVRGAAAHRQEWDLRQLHHLSDPDMGAAALADLERGATSLLVEIGDAELDRLDDALSGVRLDQTSVHLRPGRRFAASSEALVGVWADSGVPVIARAGGLGIDPLGALGPGSAATEAREVLAEAASVAAAHAATHPGVTAMAVDASAYAEAGAPAAEELAWSLATGVAYLRGLTSAGLGTAAAVDQLEFTYSATADQFVTIAKLRAARRLWARVAEACSVRPVGQRQHAITSATMMGDDDPWVNLIRATVACLAAGLGGADAVTVRPPGAGLDAELARRLAANTQLLLLEESSLGRVIDPGGGSWYVESLSAQLADRAWQSFQAIEGHGGMTEVMAAVGAAP